MFRSATITEIETRAEESGEGGEVSDWRLGNGAQCRGRFVAARTAQSGTSSADAAGSERDIITSAFGHECHTLIQIADLSQISSLALSASEPSQTLRHSDRTSCRGEGNTHQDTSTMPLPDSEQSRSDALPFEQTLATLHSLLPEKLRRPHVGIVCGSGLHTLAAAIRDVVEVPYATLPGFGKSTVPGHKSSLAFGLIGPGEGVPVVAMLGRLHPYEGHKLSAVVYPIRVMARLGIRNLIITNAAGALNPDIDVGTIVVIQDHLAFPNLTGMNPLLGPQLDPKYPRFLALSSAYSVSLRRYAFLAAHKLQLGLDALAEGVYAWVSGPTYETPAEGRMLRNAGADVVGMSTIPEVVAGKEEGLEVLVLSLVTNKVVIPTRYRSIREEVEAELAGKPVVRQDEPQVSHEEVLLIGKQKAEVMKSLVEKIVELIASEPSSASPASA